MISRTRVLQLKQFEVQQGGVEFRLTAPDKAQGGGDTFVVMRAVTTPSVLRELADGHGKKFRITIEEMEDGS